MSTDTHATPRTSYAQSSASEFVIGSDYCFTLVLVDSGADMNVFNIELAEALGIDLESGVPAEITGVTGEPVSVYVHPVELTVGDRSFTVPAAFVPAPNPFGLAGQRGFFDQFKVTFNFREEELELAEPPSNAHV